MPPTNDDDTIDPGSGRILGAGSGNLQKAIDALTRSVTANTFSIGRLVSPNTPSASFSALHSQTNPPSSADAPEPTAPSAWPSRARTTTVMALSPVAAAPTPTPAGGSSGAPSVPEGDESGTKSFFRNARDVVAGFQRFGNAQLRLALPMDNYAQWAGIQQGSPLVSDGTNGGTVNSIRKYVFGSRNANNIMWAQNVADASAAAFTATRNSGFTPLSPGTRNVNPQFSGYLGNIKDLSVLNPMMNAATTANMFGTLSSTRGLYASMMYGYQPVLGPGGRVDRSALGSFTDSVLQRAYGNTSVNPRQLAAGLGQNGILNANINAYVNAAGGNAQTVQALEDYVTGRNTAGQHGISGTQFDSLLNAYEAGGSKGKAAGNKLKKIGITNSILQSQKDVTAAEAQNTSDLLDSFGPAIKKANEALAGFHDFLNRIVNIPGWKQILGYTSAFSSVFGGVATSAFGALGGYGVARVIGGRGGGLMPLTTGRSLVPGSTGGPSPTGALRSALTSPAALAGAASFLAYGAGQQHWSQADSKVSGFRQWEKETNNVPDIWKLKPKRFEADRKKFDKLWDEAQKAPRTTGNDGIGGGALAPSGGGGPRGAGGPGSGYAIVGKNAAGAIASALNELGKPYQWGGTGPDAWDCSGLMQHAYGSIGVRLPRTSQQQMTVGEPVDRKNIQPGDLMFPYPGHVVMYVGGGKIVEAPRTGENVRTASVNEYGRYAAIRRVVGSVGNLSALSAPPGNTQKRMSDLFGGNSGSVVVGSGSVEEVDAINTALAAVAGAVGNSTQTASSSNSNTVTATSGPWKKDQSSIQKARALGKQLAAQTYNWTGNQWDSLDKLITGESGWRWWADNPTSHAYGLGQSLPGNKMASAGKDWKTNPATQLKWTLKYMHDRYGDPENAYSTWSSRSPHWYDKGAWRIPNDQMAMVHKGEMIIERPKADTIRNALMRDAVNVKDAGSPASGGSGNGISLVFNKGSVSFMVSGALTETQAQAAATAFASTLANDGRLKALARGL